ncbi:uncharacterized protein K444DRAFT_532479 [Hyaloscypha bicolor E]|uniref:PHD-type domain-containing protein n=1 Tax=Hyaloscypha bicolor E TaxID=1095630 RepID=A0A2J6T525_9HELO|nr:uncharacterized protein K444DRAFT_532479 [Hyaloscypha bicolor E]PMD58124.1 hypothetical protein K444DRAFT_532479 [Hyaloscypha bicolor E]
MSWDQQAYSFGNAQPPTPTQTPTSGQFPSPTFQTPRNNSNFESRSGWTPTFAEEYSVFNSTPGRLTSSQHNFVESSTPGPSTASAQSRRLSTTGDITAELASHVHHFSPNPGLPLPPVDPSNQLPSSPGPYSTTHNRFDDSATKKITPRKPKKRLEEAFSGQTATPPASTSKGSRKLAPKISTDKMQNESQDCHYGNSQTPTHHPNVLPFTSSSAEFFYPMSAPATAPVFANTKPFWDPDASMSGMDLDFPADVDLFNTSSHRISNSFDWGRSNQMFQETVNVSQPSTQPEQTTTSKRQRPLAPKLPTTTAQLGASLPPFDFDSAAVSDDPFSVANLGGGVDPGLLFSRTNSVSMPSGFGDSALPPARPVTSHMELKPYQHQLRESQRDQEELRRSRGSRENSKNRRIERGTVSSPIKGPSRPGLQRSISDSRSKRTQDRVISRTGRISPVKHQRPISLTSIPEFPAPRTRTEVKFTIDANGRARTETVVVEEEPKTARGGPPANEEWDSSQDESSSDDEPILVPSRNSSFAIPPQSKAPKLARFETSNRGVDVRRHSASGYTQSESSSQRSTRRDSMGSEAETVMEEDDGSGDATLVLRKIMEERKKSQLKARHPRHHRYVSDNTPRGNSQYSSSTNISPTTVTDPDGATPSSSRSGTTRCVCNNPDSEGFMIQCESCDNWLHSECVGIDRRSLPPVYICAFCAQTPNMRGGRIREQARANTQLGSSPLAHKSFKSFR